MIFNPARVRAEYRLIAHTDKMTIDDIRDAINLAIGMYATSSACVTAEELLGMRPPRRELNAHVKQCPFCTFTVRYVHYCCGMDDDGLVALLVRIARIIHVKVMDLWQDLRSGDGGNHLTFPECLNATTLTGALAAHRDECRNCKAFLVVLTHMTTPRFARALASRP